MIFICNYPTKATIANFTTKNDVIIPVNARVDTVVQSVVSDRIYFNYNKQQYFVTNGNFNQCFCNEKEYRKLKLQQLSKSIESSTLFYK